MATVTIPDEDRTLHTDEEISDFLGQYGIWYRRFEGDDELSEDATEEEILAAYSEPIQELMEEGNYQTADVINVTPDVPNLDQMLAKFEKEHTHSENEVRFIVKGSGLFHINPPDAPVFRIEVVKGDMINVPHGTRHWFHLCDERTIRAIRLFEDTSGWTPRYTESKAEEGFQPLCFGPAYLDKDDTLIESVI